MAPYGGIFGAALFGNLVVMGLSTVKISEAFQIRKNQHGGEAGVTKFSNMYILSYWQKNKQENNVKLQ